MTRPSRRSASSPSGTRRRLARVLVIDDEPAVAEALRSSLAADNEVIVVHVAAEALARLDAGERYDVVLCDLMMPVMDGIEFHRHLSATLPHEADRVVFITGGALTARVEAFFLRVPNVVMEKPIDIEGVRALVDRRQREASVPRSA